jgi:putative hydrolase of the HAD superfamily
MSKAQWIFFDLDNTLWDFTGNSRLALEQIVKEYQKEIPGLIISDFIERYRVHNDFCWAQYRAGEIDQATLRWKRFFLALDDFSLGNRKVALDMSSDYLDAMADQRSLVEGAMELLEYLEDRYSLHIITNGFEDVQHRKIYNSGIQNFFGEVITSEQAGALKPNPKIFEVALQKADAKAEQSIYVGDSLKVDIASEKVGMPFIWFNPDKMDSDAPVRQVEHLSQLKEMF